MKAVVLPGDVVQQTNNQGHLYDVAICGGGLAGQTLARQLKLALPHCSVVLIDRLARPLPEAAFKVGESTVEVGAHYLTEKLQLTDYFAQHHLRKLGLRFFFGHGADPLQERPEFGLSTFFPTVSTYQIDRGVLENDLRQLNAEAGVDLLEGLRVQDIKLMESAPHTILLTAPEAAQPYTVQARWVVDATGRRRFLQKQLHLTKETRQKHSAVWFRLAGRIDIDDLVPREHHAWHNRVPNEMRYYSTNHLMGEGYWVWIIPLVSNYTSVGIVVQDDRHAFDELNTYPLATQWLRQHEPALAAYIKDHVPVDFRCMHHYSYSSRQVFSSQRWACVGEAGVFADPFYSPGTDVIGFSNTMTTEMIKRDLEGKLTPEVVTSYNQFLLSYNDRVTDSIQRGYVYFNNPVVMTAKVLWDTTAAWCFIGPQMFHSLYVNAETTDHIRKLTASFFFLGRRMQQLFADWAAASPGRLTFDFIDYLQLDFLCRVRQRNLQTGKSLEALTVDQRLNMELVEELAQVLFVLAVEDVMPAYLEHFSGLPWLHAWCIGLEPETWQADGLFRPASSPRDLRALHQQIRSLFCVKQGDLAVKEGSLTA